MAVEVIPGGSVGGEGSVRVARFHREARAASLSHAVFDAGSGLLATTAGRARG
jgi:hypothetical protein